MEDFQQPDPTLPSSEPTEPPPVPVQADYLYPAFWAGVCSGILSGVPLLNSACCLWMTGGGMLAVYFFYLKNGFPLKKAGDGARLGLFTGIIGSLISTAVNFGSQLLINRGVSNMMEAVRKGILEMERSLPPTTPPDPQAKEAIAWAMTTEGTVSLMILGSLMMCVLFVLLSTAGGALGVRTLSQGPGDQDRQQ